MIDLAQALSVAIEAARAAGMLLRDDFHRPGGPRGEGDKADADLEAEELIRERLLAVCPWSYRGEETTPHRSNNPDDPIWLVDPNDGTAAYLKGWRGSAVSIGLLYRGQPVLGVVYAFGFPDNEGDLIAWAEGQPMTRNGQPIQVNLADGELNSPTNPPPLVLINQEGDRVPLTYLACVQPARYLSVPSIAYRLARVAAGDGVAAISLSGPKDWDYAAGHALVRAAQGILVDQDGVPVQYSAEGKSSTRWCFGGAPAAVRQLVTRNWLQVVRAEPEAGGPLALLQPSPGRAVREVTQLNRAQGCLLGQLAGDALGGLVEFKSVEAIRARYPHGCRHLHDGGTWNNLAGQPTDDSEMALMLARTLIREGSYQRGAVLDGYLHWLRHAWDIGGTIGASLRAARSGATRDERLHLTELHARDTPSNGCLMRISPLGIFAAGKPARGAELARSDARLTHPNPLCQDSCGVYVAALAHAIGSGGGPQECYHAALAEAERGKAQPEVKAALLAARTSPPPDYITQMGSVLLALQNAFYQLLHAPTLEEGVVDTVMRGGDTDTTAAIAGALLGAVHGRRGIPAQWQQTLLSCRPAPGMPTAHAMPREFWPVDALILAEALLVEGQGGC